MDCGIDIGYAFCKGVAGDRQAYFPSFVARPSEAMLSLNGSERIVIRSDRCGEWMIGNDAIRMSGGTRRETSDWITSPEWIACFYAVVSELTRATSVELGVVTGLPVADFARGREVIRSRLIGEHLIGRDGRYSQRITISPDSLRVIPQAWGGVLSVLLDDQGRVADPQISRQKVGVIDIGGHNVGYLSVDGLTDVPSESRSTERGVWNVARSLRSYLEAHYPGMGRLRDHAVMRAVIERRISNAADVIDLRPVIEPLLADIGDEIVETAAQYWGERAAVVSRILVIGGGAYLWGDRIKQAFPQAEVLPRPEFSNAAGYARFAAYLRRGK